MQLATLDNPDGANTDARTWLRGPAHLGYFYTFFTQTLTQNNLQGVVHIMVVNSFTDTRGVDATAAIGGEHWFVAAWYVDPTPP